EIQLNGLKRLIRPSPKIAPSTNPMRRPVTETSRVYQSPVRSWGTKSRTPTQLKSHSVLIHVPYVRGSVLGAQVFGGAPSLPGAPPIGLTLRISRPGSPRAHRATRARSRTTLR